MSVDVYHITWRSFHEIILFIVKVVKTSDPKHNFFSYNPDSVLNMFYFRLFFYVIGTLCEVAIGHD
jgi:hypothetical protein